MIRQAFTSDRQRVEFLFALGRIELTRDAEASISFLVTMAAIRQTSFACLVAWLRQKARFSRVRASFFSIVQRYRCVQFKQYTPVSRNLFPELPPGVLIGNCKNECFLICKHFSCEKLLLIKKSKHKLAVHIGRDSGSLSARPSINRELLEKASLVSLSYGGGSFPARPSGARCSRHFGADLQRFHLSYNAADGVEPAFAKGFRLR